MPSHATNPPAASSFPRYVGGFARPTFLRDVFEQRTAAQVLVDIGAEALGHVRGTLMALLQTPTAAEDMQLLLIDGVFTLTAAYGITQGGGTDITLDLKKRAWSAVFSGGTSIINTGTFKPDSSGVSKSTGFDSVDGSVTPQVLVMTSSAMTGAPTKLWVGLTFEFTRS